MKISRAGTLRPAAEAKIDAHFAKLINAELGPLATLYALKRAQAEAGSGALLDDDAEAVLARSAEQDARLADLDRQRREFKARIRSASTASEINEILGELA